MFDAGTNPISADSDGDGLSDGNELLDLDTNPKLADTDGDGSNDNTEVGAGTNPNDPNSFP